MGRRFDQMSPDEWKSAEAYEALQAYAAPELAYEFLRRNPDYVRDRDRLGRARRAGQANSDQEDAFARKWGARFP
jgi:hypothetical protein